MSRLMTIFLGLGLWIGFANCDRPAATESESETDTAEPAYEGGTAAVDDERVAQLENMQREAKAEKPDEAPGLIVSTTDYAGIQPNDAISAHGNRLRAGVMKNGEGTFEVYHVLDENGEIIGYAQPNYADEKLLGDIVITSPRARTADGVRIGTTYGELRKKYPGLEVHGSEIEGRVYAQRGNHYYRLDTYDTNYNLDPDGIDDKVKVMTITLSNAQKK